VDDNLATVDALPYRNAKSTFRQLQHSIAESRSEPYQNPAVFDGMKHERRNGYSQRIKRGQNQVGV
jgi:hypothetical protein